MATLGARHRIAALVAACRAPVEPLLLLAAVFLSARFCLALPHGAQRISPVWLPSALILAALLRRDGRCWALLIAAGVAGQFLAGTAAGFTGPRVGVRVAAALVEYVGAAIVVRRAVGRELDLETPRHFLVLCLASVGCALAGGVLQAAGLALVSHEDALGNMRGWSLSHPMCLLVLTPCLLVLSRPRRHLGGRGLTTRAVWALGGMLAVSLLVFGQSRYPMLFLPLPVLVWVSLEAGVYGAAVAVLVIASVALPATMAGLGPVSLSRGDVAEKAAVLQLFLAVSLFSSLPVAALQARWRKAQAQAQDDAQRARRAEALAVEGEARQRSLTEGSPDAIGALDMAGVLTFVSPAVEAITGYSAEELTGRSLVEHIAHEDVAAVRANFRALQNARNGKGEPIEYRFRRKDGTWIWLQANPRLVRDAAGEPVGTVDVVRDISTRKRMEGELETALEAARAAAQAKSDFVANMSHELRTPLTAIIGYAEVLRCDPAIPNASRKHAEHIRSAGSTLLALVNDVLDVSRAEAKGVELHPRRTDLAAVVRTSVDMVRPQAQAASLALCVEHSGELGAVAVDPDRLQQVLVNLLGNAVKFTARGVVTTTLRGAVAGDMLEARISVADTGVGIPADRLARIFDRFEQADGAVARRYGGAGLGLAISRSLVCAMGGELTVESTLGAGSVFTVRLRLPLVSEERSPEAGAQDHGGGEEGKLFGLRVLLAEDVAVNRDLIALMLTPLGVRLQSVADGAAAVEAASVEAFDVVLMDMQMPVMDGLEATRRIRAGAGPSARARIVALTANVMADQVDRCVAAGMDGHLGKPLNPGALTAELRLALPAPRPVTVVALKAKLGQR